MNFNAGFTAGFSAEDCRRDFPSLSRSVQGVPLAFLDGPAGTQVPEPVIAAMAGYYRTSNANTHGEFPTSRETDRLLDATRETVAAFLGAPSGREISFGQNMTTLNFSLSHALAREMAPGDEIVITELDHEANRGPWLHLRERGIVVKEVALRSDGRLDAEERRSGRNGQPIHGDAGVQSATGGAVSTQRAHVLSSGLGDCGSPSASQVLTTAPQPGAPGTGRCVETLVAIDSGPNAGAKTLLESSPGPGQPQFRADDHIRVVRQVDAQGATTYAFYDFERGWSLVGLGLAFAVVIVAVARWRGLLALVGIVVAFLVLVVFLLPALRDGAPAVPVALVASAAIPRGGAVPPTSSIPIALDAEAMMTPE